MSCQKDPAWCLAILQAASPNLEELHLVSPPAEHFAAVQGMPRLQRLHLTWSGDHAATPDRVPPRASSGLKSLRVKGLPRAITQSLLQSHAVSLQDLELEVGAVRGEEWPFEAGDLAAFLRPCGLRLARLVLVRPSAECDAAVCRGQVRGARGMLRHCSVKCDRCDGAQSRFISTIQ